METLIFISFFIFGAIVGSFLNVVAYRFKTGKKFIYGRSFCMSCGKSLRWYELIPIFSFLFLRGRCSRCKSRISPQYLFVEIATGLLFVMVLYKFLPFFVFSPWVTSLLIILNLVVFCLLLLILIYDIRHKIIPNNFVYPFIVISFLLLFINPFPGGPVFILPSWQSLIAGPVLALPFVLLWLFSKGRLMGLGDGKLILGIGWCLGLSAGLFSLIVGFWVGALTSLLLIVFPKKLFGFKKRNFNLKSEIPMAPFLIVSMVITYLFSLDMSCLMKIFG